MFRIIHNPISVNNKAVLGNISNSKHKACLFKQYT